MMNIWCMTCGKEYVKDYKKSEITEPKKGYQYVKCEYCGGKAKIMGVKMGGQEPMTGYWCENLGPDPIYIESREHRRALMKAKKVEIMPYKKNEYTNYRPVVNGHKITEHEYAKAQKRNFFQPRYRGPDIPQ